MLALLLTSFLSCVAFVTAPCDPLTSTCPAIPGLASGQYSIDFTQQVGQPAQWTLANYETVSYGSNGAEFTIAKAADAPAMWTSFYFLFGTVEVVLQSAPGTGVITGVVLMSDDLDEIDIGEWSGNNFASGTSEFQTNYFGKGITGNYDRATMVPVSSPQTTFHTYTLHWTPSAITWSLDGKVVRTLTNSGATSGDYQFPQTPSQLHLSLWDGGGASESAGVVDWAGGYTDLSKVPFTAYVKSVKITTPNLCPSFQYPSNFNGTYQAVKCGGSLTTTTSSTTTSRSTTASTTPSTTSKSTTTQPTMTSSSSASVPTCSTSTTYAVQSGDYYYKIATNFGISAEELEDANPNVDPDGLLVGQTLTIPAGYIGVCGTSTSIFSTSATTSSMTHGASTTTTSSTTTSTFTSTYSCTTQCSPSSTSTASWNRPTGILMPALPSSTQSSVHTSTTSSNPASTSTALASFNCNLSPFEYTVQSGDNGYEIATICGHSFDSIRAINPGVNLNELNVGQVLHVPTNSSCGQLSPECDVLITPSTTASTVGTSQASSATTTSSTTSASSTGVNSCKFVYTVQSGDNGDGIATECGITFDAIRAINPGINWNALNIGQTLNLPSGANCGQPASTCGGVPTTTTASISQTTIPSTTTPWTSSIMSTASSLYSVIFSGTSSTRPNSIVATTASSSSSARQTTTSTQSTTTAQRSPMTSSTTARSTTTMSTTRTTTSSTTISRTTTASSPACTTDALLSTMALPKYFSSAKSYCSSYTQAASPWLEGPLQVIPVNRNVMPTWMASNPLARVTASVSSACSCLPKTVSAAPTTTPFAMGGWWAGGWRR